MTTLLSSVSTTCSPSTCGRRHLFRGHFLSARMGRFPFPGRRDPGSRSDSAETGAVHRQQASELYFRTEVIVMVQQINREKFNLSEEVALTDSYALTNSPRVPDAIALAGGFRDFPKQKSIYILRQNPRSECELTTSDRDGCVFTGAESGRVRSSNRPPTRTHSTKNENKPRPPHDPGNSLDRGLR